jgi:tetratricopeptide (TPR) repeat protein
MHETGFAPIPVGETISAAGELSALSPHPSKGRRFLRWVGRCIRGGRAALSYLFRHPLRALAIFSLLTIILAGAGMAGVSLWASYHLRAARADLERYHTHEAVSHLQSALTIWPRDPETLLLSARAARRTGALGNAERCLHQYQTVRGADDPDLVLERVLLRAERGDVDRVKKYCLSLIEQNHPATPLILEALARGFLHAYRPREAAMALDQWLQRQPDNPQALIVQGELYDLQGRQYDAIASYRRALTVDAEFDEARLRLCAVQMQLGLAEEALPHLEYLTRRFPENLMVQVYLVRVYDRLRRPEDAEKMLEKVLARQPHFAAALAERGKLALRAGQREQAEKWLREAAQVDPSDYQTHYQLYQCLEQNGKSDDAREEQKRLRQIEDDIKNIQEISTMKMQLAPHDPDLHYQAGMIALRAGATEEGLRWLHSALQEDPNHAATHQALAEHYQRVGDFARAREHRQKVSASGSQSQRASTPYP